MEMIQSFDIFAVQLTSLKIEKQAGGIFGNFGGIFFWHIGE